MNKPTEFEVYVPRKIKIAKSDFESYVEVQMSGITNMFDMEMVSQLTGLNKDKIRAITKHHEEIENNFKGIVEKHAK